MSSYHPLKDFQVFSNILDTPSQQFGLSGESTEGKCREGDKAGFKKSDCEGGGSANTRSSLCLF